MTLQMDKKEIIHEFLNTELKALLNIPNPSRELIERAYYLIKVGANPLETSGRGSYNILKDVIAYGDIEFFKTFVKEFKFDLNDLTGLNDKQSSAFHVACLYLKPEIARWLIKNHNISKETIQEELHDLCTYRCTQKGALEMAEVLIENGAKIHYTKFQKENVLHKIVGYMGKDTKVYDYLKKVEVEEMKDEVEKKKEESSNNSNKTIDALSNDLKNANKEIATLKEHIDVLKEENQKLREKDKLTKEGVKELQDSLKSLFI